MDTSDTVVIGAGHAGLAVSRLLTEAGRDHVVLERGRIAERWRTERWDSLRLLTPNWMTRLPGQHYTGPDPDGYMRAPELIRHLERYAESFAAPVVPGRTVLDVSRAGPTGYRVVTDSGTWRARHVVIATGPHGTPRLPGGLAAGEVLTANHYRRPAQLASGAVLVIGASSSGVQIADELNRAGREVVLAVGRHTRLPRRYRGMDIFRWLEATGRLARTIDEVGDPVLARREPSMQLVGHPSAPEPRDVDLVALQERGVRLVGRFAGITRGRARFHPDLAHHVAAADARMHRVLDAIDAHADHTGRGAQFPPQRPRRLHLPASTAALDLARAGVDTVIVAAGYRPDYPWLGLPVTGPDGAVRQYRGVTPADGVYVVGQRFQHRRDSGFIDGARRDAAAVVGHLLAGSAAAPADTHGKEPAA